MHFIPSRLAIVAAMPEELEALIAALADARCEHIGQRAFWTGRLDGVPVVAVLSGIGKVASSMTTTLLIDRFQVRSLLFTGVAGGLGEGVNVGDVVVATDLVQHDMDASPIFPRYEIPGRARSRLPADGAMSDQVMAAASAALSPQALGQGGPLGDVHLAELGLSLPRIHRGLVLSGDRFVSSNAESQALRQAFPQALAVEMEGAAVAQVCHDFGLPFAVLRVISDRADQSAHVDFMRFVAEIARRYSLAIVRAALPALARA